MDAHALARLRWRCRRGLLENDLLIERFFARHAASLTEERQQAIEALMQLPDPELLDLLLARRQPEGGFDRDDIRDVLALMRFQRPREEHP